MTVKELSTVLATWFVVIGTVIGGYAALRTYRQEVEKQLDDREKQTFALVLHFISPDFLPIRDKMIKVMRAAESCADPMAPLAQMTEAERFAFFEFFDIVHACTEAGMCDAGLVERVFVPYANGHWPALEGYVENVRRAEEPNKLKVPFAEGLQKLAHTPIGPTDCPKR
jgi:hypothetical protein